MSDRDETTPQERQRVAQRLRDQPTFDMYTDYEACGATFRKWTDFGNRSAYCPMCGRRIEWEDE